MNLRWNNIEYIIRTGFSLRPVRIIKGLSLELKEGDVLALIGPNGAGKTTTIKLGCGIIRPSKGEVSLDGMPIESTNVKRDIGFLTEVPYVYGFLKVREWLEVLGRLSGYTGKQLKYGSDKVISEFGLIGLEDRLLSTLSKGQLQRVGFAQALLHNPHILLLDEPLSGLDPIWRYRIIERLIDLNKKGKSILFSSHILTDIERIASKIAIIKDGKLFWHGSIDELTREVKGYEIGLRVFEQGNLEEIESELSLLKMEKDSEGNYIINIPYKEEDLRKLFNMVSNGRVTINWIIPKREELAEVISKISGDLDEN